MKIKCNVNLNRISYPYQVDFERARLYHLKHGVDISFVFTNIDVNGYKSTELIKPDGLKMYILTGSQLVVKIDPSADINIFMFDQMEWSTPKGSNYPLKADTPTGSCFSYLGKPFINIGTYKNNPIIDETWIQIAHEIMHGLVQMANTKGFNVRDVMDTYIENTNPDSLIGNFAEQWNRLDKFLNQNIMSTYKYFKPSEIVGLNPDLVSLLDKMRGECGFPFKINSGYRTVSKNTSLSDAVGDSAHLSGLAVDLSIIDSSSRFKLVQVAISNGINRIGIAKTFIHIDISKTLPNGVIWLY